MRRPWIEASAFLAAHGHPLPPASRAILYRRRPAMPQDCHPREGGRHPRERGDARYALLPAMDPGVKPVVYPDLDGLARRIQRDRQGQGLDMTEIEDLEFLGRPDAHRGVQIWTTDAGNSRDRFIGYAWLNGGGLETLQAAIRRNLPSRRSRPDRAA